MPLSKVEKEQIVREYGQNDQDTGSSQVQVALLTARIRQLTEHLKINTHDEHSRRGLLKLVGQRRRLLRYMNRKNPESYRDLIQRLGLRR